VLSFFSLTRARETKNIKVDVREMVKLRNAVIHGDFSAEVPAEQIEDLLTQVQAIASDIMSVMPELKA